MGQNNSIWAIIPAAGLGTRMVENAVLGCKELVQVGGISMLERTIREVEEAGIEQIVVVSSPNKPAIDLELENRGVQIVHQLQPNGLVDAVRCAQTITGNSPLLIALPDVLFTDVNPSTVLCNQFEGDSVLTIVEAEEPWANHLCDTGRITELEGEYIRGISDKNPDRAFPMGEKRITGRGIWTQAFWEVAGNNEVEALRKLASKRILRASLVKTKYIDVGLPIGYEYAQSIFNR
ncbi:MAG: NTP transferase domain-containing protein [Candidatus Thermoplasmatota archaeon]|nr:NTP transferase domain-containing protein [Candidatus Thermoplasmatota archaeon]